MTRQSISFTTPNDEWLKAKVKSNEYSSKSELINDLIRQARNESIKIDYIKNKINDAEKSGFTEMSQEDILNQSKSRFNGEL